MTVLALTLAWLGCLALYVVLQARRPRWEYPAPPVAAAQEEWRDAA